MFLGVIGALLGNVIRSNLSLEDKPSVEIRI